MNIKKLNLITSILMFHSGDDDDLQCSAEHDEMYLGGPERDDMEIDLIHLLEELGCSWNDEFDCWHIFT